MPQASSSHSRAWYLRSASKPVLKNIAPDAAGAIGAVAGLEPRLNHRDELGVMYLAGACRTVEPEVEAGARDNKDLTQPTDWPDMAVLGDAGEPHIASRAKKAAAFFRMSRSAQRRATSVFSAAISAKSAQSCPFPGTLWQGLQSGPAWSGVARSPPHRGLWPPAPPQLLDPSPALRRKS